MLPLAVLRYLLHHDMQHLILHVTARCNLRCAHCFVDFTPVKDIPLERYQALAKEVGRLFWLDISGGEPFLRKDLAEIVSAFDCSVVQIPTNGLLGDSILEQVQEMRRRMKPQLALSVSIDGLEATHDEIRGRSGACRAAWDTFERLKALGVPVKINTVIMRRNVGELLELMREVRRRGPDFHSVILQRGTARAEPFGLPPLADLRRMGPAIFDILGTYDYGRGRFTASILRNYHRYLWNLSLATLEQQRQAIPCLGGRAHMVVYGDGSVGSCEMLPPVGNIQQQSWAQILGSEALARQRELIRRKGCWCTHNCAMLDSILLRLRSFFPLLHQRLATESASLPSPKEPPP